MLEGYDMDERNKKRIREHLQDTGAQERIQRYMEKGRAEATVTISRAAELFQLSENRLRDWEEYGLLSPLRPTGPKGRRLYTPGELDKLAIIRELLDAGYAPSDIPPDVDLVWHTIAEESEHPESFERRGPQAGSGKREKNALSIPPRIDQARNELCWRYFISRALRFSLMLICEDIPHTTNHGCSDPAIGAASAGRDDSERRRVCKTRRIADRLARPEPFLAYPASSCSNL